MGITADGNALVLNTVIAASIDNIDILSCFRASGEFFRIPYQTKDTVSPTERKYIFYLTEADANDTITKLSLYGGDANTALGTGTELAEQVVDIPKNNTQSLLIYWNVKVVS